MKRPSRRRGSILLLVLIIVPALALSAYSFTHWMRAEAQGAVTHLQMTQARWLANSGVDYVQALLSDPTSLEAGAIDFWNNPAEFANWPVAPEFRSAQGSFSIIAATPDPSGREIRYGLVNESAKIPLHRRRFLLRGNMDEQRERLMGLPNMTAEVADGLLDWIDKDSDPRPLGAEADYYLGLPKPYSPRNAPPRTIGELLLIRGMTPWLLYGEDVNLDGVLNPNEDDGERSWPPDNGDGVIDRGWLPYLTVHSSAADTNPDGEPKIDLNSDLNSKKEVLVELFTQEWFDFVQQYKVSRAGKKIRAVSELIDAKIDPPKVPEGAAQVAGALGLSQGNQRQQEIKSPWTRQNVSSYLDDALAYLSVETPKRNEGVAVGRVDLTGAPLPVIQAIPGLNPGSVEGLAQATSARTPGDRSCAWILVDGLVSLEEFQAIENYLTTQGRVFQVESVGFFSTPGNIARVQAVIDATKSPARIVSRRELVDVPQGYPHETLINQSMFIPEVTEESSF